ncbi:MAG: hypothetical protein M1812_005142 [Candelaria pacifica]|nr:MAG: hypothetical protein M1812_005142 [Candelaria pacifica]
MLTPIHIRGKNKRSSSKKSKQPSATSSSSTHPSKRSRGRPLKPESSPSSEKSLHSKSNKANKSKKQQNSTPAQRSSKKRKINISPLESLPVELLQTIFITSLNLNLPLASPRLASILNNDHIHLQLCLAAFTGSEHAEPYKHLIHLPEIPPHPSIQSAILRQPWLTHSLLSRSKAKRLETLQKAQEKHDIKSSDPQIDKTQTYNLAKSLLINQSDKWPRFSKDVQMPERLLRSPWSPDKTNLLRELINHGLRIDWVYTSSGEIVLASLLEATIHGQLQIINLLTENLSTLPTTAIIRQAVLGLSKEDADAYDDGGIRCIILEMLVDLSKKRGADIDWDDSEIMAWAVAANQSGDWRGRWVLRIMRSKGDESMTTPDPFFMIESP